MSSVKVTVDSLRVEFKLWQGLLLNCKENAADCSHNVQNWSLKDILAHLTSWQEVTLARLVAGRLNNEPDYPGWFPGTDPETDEALNQVNALIYHAYEEKTLAEVKKEWERRFSEILLVCQLITEQEFLEPDRYSWLGGYPLLAVLQGTLEHHQEHRDALMGKK